MNSADNKTVTIKPCRSCGAGLFEENRFCRNCGVRQLEPTVLSSESEVIADGNSDQAAVASYNTTKLSRQVLYHPVSGPLVKAVAQGVPASASRSPARDVSKKMLLGLMAIPIWVMIILLSPFDAYASAKIIGQRI